MKQISLLIKPASGNCNLRCSYCFYYDVVEHNLGIMTQETVDKLLEETFNNLDKNGTVAFSFQGGEPTLAGLDWFKYFVNKADELNNECKIQYAIQTNATLLDEDWVAFFKQYRFLVGVSLDGFQVNMDKFRFDAKKKGVYFQVLKGIELLRKKEVPFNILTVVTQSLSKHSKALFNFYKENHFDYIQLIPCLPSINLNDPINKEALSPKAYAEFFISFFDYWIEDFKKGGKMDVNLFSNILGMLEGYPPYQCGMLGRCYLQQVVEADGSVYPCDFYVLEELKIGNFNTNTLVEMQSSKNAKTFLESSLAEKAECKTCEFRRFCHGGCRRQNVCYVEDGYCGYRDLLSHIIPIYRKMFRRQL